VIHVFIEDALLGLAILKFYIPDFTDAPLPPASCCAFSGSWDLVGEVPPMILIPALAN
jgi:hypothetical protein